MKKLTVGFIGNGKSANRYQSPFIRILPDKYTIKTVWSRNLSHDAWERIADVYYTEDLNELLNDPEIDLVVVSTPVMHYEYAKMALEAGKNVLAEKPFT